MQKRTIPVAIILGSESDRPIMEESARALALFGIRHETFVLSAHRTPEETLEFARHARARGVRVLIAGAGAAAHLAGFLAAVSELPVIGVPLAPPNTTGYPFGSDALLSMVQMPKGVPVACVAINGAWNAGLLAAQILGAAEEKGTLLNRVRKYKEELKKKVLSTPRKTKA
ncbi:5-(carboxyamino)imidazole ribonucleotide mutase [Bdellovibrionota bacterium FG-2]